MNPNQDRLFIGIAGGTGSGKTLVAKTICKDMGEDRVTIIMQDSYYRDLPHLPFEERARQNFDHPDAVDSELLLEQIKLLLDGQPIEQPIYDFKQHLRTHETKTTYPHPIILLEGILIFYYPEIRDLMDIKVFVDTDADIRFIRRLKRDVRDRGRTMESVMQQYKETVRPMHLEFVEPTKRYADIIVPEGGKNLVAVDLLKTKVWTMLQSH